MSETIMLDVHAIEEEINLFLDRHPIMMLATAQAERVTARSMSLIHDGLTIWFQTGSDSIKAEQMRANPRAALCADNLTMEVTVRELGHPLDPRNAFFAEKYARLHPGSFAAYSNLAFNRLFEVHPILITMWKYVGERKPCRDFYDVSARRAWREFYPIDGPFYTTQEA